MLPLEPDDPRLAIPHNAFPAAGARGPRHERYILTSDAALDQKPAEPLDAGWTTGKQPISRRWKAAIAGSCLLHAAVALCFLAGIDESAQIAGADQAGIVQLGNANEDSAAAGAIDPAVAEVTLITMLDAKPVETVTAEPVEDTSTVQPVETTQPVQPATETLSPVEAKPIEPETPAPVAPVAEPQPAEPAPRDTAAAVAETAPEILATDTVEPVEDDNTVAPSAQAVEQVVEPAAEAAPEAPAETVAEAPAETVAEPVPEETFETLAAVAPIPEPHPEAPAKPEKPVEQAEKKRATAKKEPAKPREQKSAEKRTAGSGGNAQADARRGEADGQANGKTAARSKGGNRQAAAGNAAVSNYPGKIVSKLRRALRYPAEAKRKKLRGEVQVAFTVSAGGGVGGVRVVRSSGSPVLDKAAVETVRRAAPFPAIPEGAGRSSWPFTVPLAFTR
jgi:protein TonB